MKKQLVVYVSKIKTHNERIFFRFTPNTGDEPAVWSEWDNEKGEPERVIRTVTGLELLLKTFSTFSNFKLEFKNESCIFASNPFSDNKKEKPFLDHYLLITETEENFWRKLFLDLCLN